MNDQMYLMAVMMYQYLHIILLKNIINEISDADLAACDSGPAARPL